ISLTSSIGAPDSFGGLGSTNGTDPYIRYTFRQPGTYFIRVATRELTENFEILNLTNADPTSVLNGLPNPDIEVMQSLLNPTPSNPTLQISLLNTEFEETSGIFSTTENGGRAGNITLTASSIELTNRALLNNSTSGAGRGGNVTLYTDEINLSGSGTEISANTDGSGSGGSIILQPNASDSIEINTTGDGPQISASTAPGSSGTGGNITIQNAEIAKLDNTELLTSSNGSGRAG
ncbi:MAG: hypothetical protein AAFY41_19835, partial [Bacteroidota bacterium]